ncbi:endoglucanase 12-like [Telopea speciosissima]|uniref:endoglucanase 12-like n=1 Tax=Telopea speciosissima TaxID=54955 RepID=UPI001CC731E9|nr:endoglucanase 12-like [Telopea speciosissima]
MSSLSSLSFLGFLLLLLLHEVASIDYTLALTKSLLYYEAQRSGKLPPNQRVQWRGDSGLNDGSDAGIDLVGGYYDAGDNVKFGFPMAFTVTMLAWSAVEYGTQLSSKNELSHALEAIKWGTDYLIKAHPQPDILYAEVGDGDSDHECWQRPEDMTTPRTTYKIDDQHPGADLAGETSAALAAASIVFRSSNPHYSSILISHAKELFDFGRNHPGLYQNSIPVVGKFYSSSGYEDELLWAAAWLHRATGDETYLNYLSSSGNTGGSRSMFSWDDKFLGVQVLVSKLVLEGKVGNSGNWAQYKSEAEQFICSCVQKGSNNFKKSPGGLLWWQPWNDLQYTTAAIFVLSAYSDYLSATHTDANIQCQGGPVTPTDLINFVQSQVDYILGSNPKGTSYMVGFESKYPEQVHHRGASIVSIKKDPTAVTCKGGFDEWFNKNSPNPNVLDGAIVGGPDENDSYTDSRSNFQQAEPATANSAPLVGVLARLA